MGDSTIIFFAAVRTANTEGGSAGGDVGWGRNSGKKLGLWESRLDGKGGRVAVDDVWVRVGEDARADVGEPLRVRGVELGGGEGKATLSPSSGISTS